MTGALVRRGAGRRVEAPQTYHLDKNAIVYRWARDAPPAIILFATAAFGAIDLLTGATRRMQGRQTA
ncbi:MAG: hypothetical protein ACRDJC_15995 [Thermomicrobiales bacterium]